MTLKQLAGNQWCKEGSNNNKNEKNQKKLK